MNLPTYRHSEWLFNLAIGFIIVLTVEFRALRWNVLKSNSNFFQSLLHKTTNNVESVLKANVMSGPYGTRTTRAANALTESYKHNSKIRNQFCREFDSLIDEPEDMLPPLL